MEKGRSSRKSYDGKVFMVRLALRAGVALLDRRRGFTDGWRAEYRARSRIAE